MSELDNSVSTEKRAASLEDRVKSVRNTMRTILAGVEPNSLSIEGRRVGVYRALLRELKSGSIVNLSIEDHDDGGEIFLLLNITPGSGRKTEKWNAYNLSDTTVATARSTPRMRFDGGGERNFKGRSLKSDDVQIVEELLEEMKAG